ncbi:hypothetical protein BDV93DRAFT_607245 [Ceratobasidium sp. AG-I]|nr:hypothetical protein BDV93DRAFT_607245 [Ceratobasidium sp. AG-I]
MSDLEMEKHEMKVQDLIVENPRRRKNGSGTQRNLELQRREMQQRARTSGKGGGRSCLKLGMGTSYSSILRFEPPAECRNVSLQPSTSKLAFTRPGMILGKKAKMFDLLDTLCGGELLTLDDYMLSTPPPANLSSSATLRTQLTTYSLENASKPPSCAAVDQKIPRSQEIRISKSGRAGEMKLRDQTRALPTGQPFVVLGRRCESKDEIGIPLSINCWLWLAGDGICEVIIVWELENDFVGASLPSNDQPTASSYTDLGAISPHTHSLDWTIKPVLTNTKTTGSLEYNIGRDPVSQRLIWNIQ